LLQSYQRPPPRGSFIWSIKLCYFKRLRNGSQDFQSKIIINARSVSFLWTIVASIYKIPSKIRKLWTRHNIYPQIDNFDLRVMINITFVEIYKLHHQDTTLNVRGQLHRRSVPNRSLNFKFTSCYDRLSCVILFLVFCVNGHRWQKANSNGVGSVINMLKYYRFSSFVNRS
jgi:hypothetical protein